MNIWVRAYHDNHTHYYVSTSDLYNIRVVENSWGPTWSIFADQKYGTGEVPLLGSWSTEVAAGEALKELLGGVDLSS